MTPTYLFRRGTTPSFREAGFGTALACKLSPRFSTRHRLAGSSTNGLDSEDAVVQVLAKTRFQRFSLYQSECTDSAILSFSSQKQDVSFVPLINAVRQFVKMGHANNLDPLSNRADRSAARSLTLRVRWSPQRIH